MDAAAPTRLASTYVISITPFTQEGRLDEAAFRGHLERLAAGGVGVYVGGGGSGEGYSLSPDEARRVMDIAVDTIKGKTPVRAMGVEPRSAVQMIEHVRAAQASGIDATQIYSLDQGHGETPRPQEIETYFSDVLSAIDFPSVISSHMSVGWLIPLDVLRALLDRFPHIVGLNITTPDLGYLASVIDMSAGRCEVHVGGPMQALTAMALGATGYLSSEANLAPKLARSIVDRWNDGDLQGAAAAYGKIIRVFNAMRAGGGIRANKAVNNKLGLPGGYPRKPQLPVTDDVADRVIATITALGLLERGPLEL
jgi:4-hydroxy-tetrahydrodipicolinate synthase